ncbi:MAG: 4-hydroxy-3-methylbut-2-enyl diphosphate reductase [Desulfobacteraceae bacterium 4572_35.1]|nr:MAG: 4-hydroxy-3-methylbut-2-enyl diphosphate reductase [Desulfobacteraceae bacterium 4572_35.1]
MEIVLAKSAGFCFGVKRAVNMAFKAADKSDSICSLGPLIHSPQLVKKLENEGIRVVDSVADMVDETVIVRSHGITRSEEEELVARQLKVVDATCPFVKKAQQYVSSLGNNGYAVVIVGEQEHPEVQGIVSYAADAAAWVVANVEQAQAIPVQRKIGLVAQTTQSFENFRDISSILLNKCKELRVFNTICDATAVRQQEARSIASKVDMMLVIGGRNSANTTRLASICTEIQPQTYHIETAAGINPNWVTGISTIGITAGASTPEWIIGEVMEKLREIAK